MTPAGIEPATFRFVAQHLNHCATAVPTVDIRKFNLLRSRFRKRRKIGWKQSLIYIHAILHSKPNILIAYLQLSNKKYIYIILRYKKY